MTKSDLTTRVRRRLHGRRLVLTVAAVALVVYAITVVLYAFSGRVTDSRLNQDPDYGGITVLVTPQNVNAAAETISTQVTLHPSDALAEGDGVTLAGDITVVMSPVIGIQSSVFPAGTIPETHSIDLLAPGAIENWPFDTYDVGVAVRAYVTENGVQKTIPSKVFVNGYLPGWNLTPSVGDDFALKDAISGRETEFHAINIAAARSWSTLAFGILLLGLMIVIAGLVLYVAISVYRGRRKVEASFMSWMGAMLFATIPLRGFLPGSPPIGSWIDFLIVLWVFIALVTGLVIYVSAWMRWGSPSAPIDRPE